MKRRVRVTIDLGALVRNYRRIVEHANGLKVLCVLKANAYGLGVGEYARALVGAGCREFGVAEPHEALQLVRLFSKIGKRVSVQVLSSILPDEIHAMVKAGVVLPIVDFRTAQLIDAAAAKLGVMARVHFKIDTGMGRLGIRADDALDVIRSVMKLKHLKPEGIFSHCPMAYEPKNEFTKKQIASFAALVKKARDEGFVFKKVHIAASDALNNFPEATRAPFTMIRTGINLHGSFDPNGRKVLKVEPVLAFTTRVAQVRDLPAGTTLGYGRTWKLEKSAKIATISAGYADGLPLQLTNRGFVLIRGIRCPIVGRISMDYTTVDATAVSDIKAGDDVICLGKSGDEMITPDDWAEMKGTHAYDILCSFGTRVKREIG